VDGPTAYGADGLLISVGARGRACRQRPST
jgi:hypothetical protein